MASFLSSQHPVNAETEGIISADFNYERFNKDLLAHDVQFLDNPLNFTEFIGGGGDDQGIGVLVRDNGKLLFVRGPDCLRFGDSTCFPGCPRCCFGR